MMTKRYFYTDPLAAAWMAKHFGMRFQNTNNGSEYGLVELLIHAQTGNFCHMNIHPDSLHLLEPHLDDAVEFDRWFWERQREPQYRDYPYQPHYARVTPFGSGDKHLGISSSGVCWDDTSQGASFTIPFKIIQRNGLAFMWPESEAA